MRDIVAKKVQRACPGNTSTPKNVPGLTLIIERWLEKAGKALSWFIHKLGGSYEPEIIEEPSYLITPDPHLASIRTPEQERLILRSNKITAKTKNKHRVKSALNSSGKAIKSAGKKTKEALKTTQGKLAAVQFILILGMFIYTSANRPSGNRAFEPKNIGETTENTSLHLFLPSADDYIEPKAFESDQSANTSKIPFHAWLAPWNLNLHKNNLTSYQHLSAFWLNLKSDGANFEPKTSWETWHSFARNANLKEDQRVFLTVNGNPEHTSLALLNPDTQTTHIKNLLQTVISEDFDGIDIDYEAINPDNRDLFTEYIKNLTKEFRVNRKLVSVTLEARISNQVPMDWRSIGEVADEVRIMVYDYHAQKTGIPGPISPLGWLKETLDYAIANIPKEKLVIGIGNYGYDWTEPADENGSWEGTGISFEQAINLAKEKNSPIIRAAGIDDRGYDIGSIPTFTYTDEHSKQHAVWFEDRASLQAKVNLINQYPLAGIIFWSVGLGDADFWQENKSN